MNILFTGFTSTKGGKETFIFSIIKSLPKNINIYILGEDGKKLAYEEELNNLGCKIIKIKPRNFGLINYIKSLVKIYKNIKFDVVWAHKTSLSSCEDAILAKILKVKKVIMHSHSSNNMGGKFTYIMHKINKVFVKYYSDLLLSCSEEASKWFYGKKESTIINNSFEVDKYIFNEELRRKIREKYFICDNELVVGHIGRFGPEKNHKKIVNVFYELLKIKKDAKLFLIGDGELRDEIESKAKELDIHEKIVFFGSIDNVFEILQAMDVFIFPSLFEGLPYALLEAQASGLYALASDTVSKESNVTGKIIYENLEADDLSWAKKLIELSNNDRNNNSVNILKEKGFDTKTNINYILENIIKI
ncbi:MULTISPECIES: glycosyltransferase [Helcococcus]|uniref:Glycosyltransferase n=1 Tax=Helcococcus bovis TaxID=3153252 RepID=A0ABW9F406_9FIRM